jgi:hypothetical protein
MFDTKCHACQKRQLIFPGQVRKLINDEQGIVAIFRCWCGSLGAERLRSTGVANNPVKEHALAS